jgi:hypothetical protein
MTLGGGHHPLAHGSVRMRLSGFVKQKITRKYETVKITFLVILAGLVLFLTAAVARAC